MMPPVTAPIQAGKAVLLIEHDQLTLRVLSGILRSRGFEVIPTSEAQGFESFMPIVDVVICAYDMPFIPVKDLLQTIKQNWPEKQLFLTSTSSIEELTEESYDHIDGFILKPFEMDQINDVIGLIAA
jgi:DNA-binding NarL/FixJ family response regulator